MNTPSGQISMIDIQNAMNAGLSTNYPGGTSLITFNDSLVRTLANRPTGNISMDEMRNKPGPLAYGTAVNAGACGINGTPASTFTQIVNDGRYGTFTAVTPNHPSCVLVAPTLTMPVMNGNYNSFFPGVPHTLTYYTRDTYDAYSLRLSLDTSGNWSTAVLSTSPSSFNYRGFRNCYSDAYSSWCRYSHGREPKIKLFDKNGTLVTTVTSNGPDAGDGWQSATVPALTIALSASLFPYWLRFSFDFLFDDSRGYGSPDSVTIQQTNVTSVSLTFRPY